MRKETREEIRAAFLIRADQAAAFASLSGALGLVNKLVIAAVTSGALPDEERAELASFARKASAAWEKMARRLEGGAVCKSVRGKRK